MPSTYKTQHLGLNSYIGTDKPKRTDFNGDNERIDAAIYEHTANGGIHVTAAEKQLWNAPFVPGSYTGDGTASRTVALGFTPRVVLAAAAGCSPIGANTNAEVLIRSGFATALGGTKGIEITQNGFIVKNAAYMPPDGETPKLNVNGTVYVYLAVK